MNVSNGIENLSQVTSTQPSANSAPAKTANSPQPESAAGDKAQVSTVAAHLAQSSGISDVRLDKVASVQAALQAGTYRVPASAVAAKVVDSMLVQNK